MGVLVGVWGVGAVWFAGWVVYPTLPELMGFGAKGVEFSGFYGVGAL